jgi:hypothetical protein
MASFKDSQKSQQGSSLSAPKITAADFFGKNGKPGYSTSEEFLEYGETLTPSDEEHLRKGANYMKEGLRTDGGSEIRRDVAGKQYQYYRFYKSRSTPGVKFILTTSIIRLINDYQNGLITIDFTLDDLINEARKIK